MNLTTEGVYFHDSFLRGRSIQEVGLFARVQYFLTIPLYSAIKVSRIDQIYGALGQYIQYSRFWICFAIDGATTDKKVMLLISLIDLAVNFVLIV